MWQSVLALGCQSLPSTMTSWELRPDPSELRQKQEAHPSATDDIDFDFMHPRLHLLSRVTGSPDHLYDPSQHIRQFHRLGDLLTLLRVYLVLSRNLLLINASMSQKPNL